MNLLIKLKNKLTSFSVALTVIFFSIFAHPAFSAVDAKTKAAIETAYTDGGTLVALSVASLIGLVAIGVGVSMVISMLRKG